MISWSAPENNYFLLELNTDKYEHAKLIKNDNSFKNKLHFVFIHYGLCFYKADKRNR